METRAKNVYMVGKNATLKLINSLKNWQGTAVHTASEAKNLDDLHVAIEYMGISQGIINSLNALELFTKEEAEEAVKLQQDIAEAIKKSALRLADR